MITQVTALLIMSTDDANSQNGQTQWGVIILPNVSAIPPLITIELIDSQRNTPDFFYHLHPTWIDIRPTQ